MLQQRVQQHLRRPAGQETLAELTEHREVEALIAQIQAQGVLPIDSTADSVGSLAVGQVLCELQDRDEHEPPGGNDCPTADGEQRGEQLVLIDGA